jgi:hypothetical protein
MATNLAVTNPTNDNPNLFGAFGGSEQDPQTNTNSQGWGSGTIFNGTGGGAAGNPFTTTLPPAATTPTPPTGAGSSPAATPTLDPMRFFRNDVGGYNPFQYANAAGEQSVRSFLGPTAQFGQTRNEGPFDMPSQSLVNYGGQNHNTGLVQQWINQFGPEMAMRMMNDQTAQARNSGGGNWTLGNDASSANYVPNLFLQSNPNVVTQPNNPTSTGGQPTAVNSSTNPNTQGTNPNSVSSALAALFGLGGQQQSRQQVDPMVQMLMLLLSGGFGGQQTAPAVSQAVPVTRNLNQYPLFY